MDEYMAMVICAPFWALGLITVSYVAAYAYHKAKTLGDSAQEQQITEQLPEKKA